MNDIQELFFELLRVAIGTQECLSRLPLAREWNDLYRMATKQSLVGVSFAALQRLGADADGGFTRVGISEMLYLTWMGMTAKIQQRNAEVDLRCAELHARLSAEGMRSCVLKGQGVGLLYSDYLLGLRQTGDIDLWIDATKEKVVTWAENIGINEKPGYLHVGSRVFEKTEVELHYRPTYMRSLRHNRRLQRFCEEHKNDWQQRNAMTVPSWEFDVVYLLSHIYRHLFGLGVGLRQLMDYYFLLVDANERKLSANFSACNTLKHLGLYDFAGAVMYVMQEVFRLDAEYMICPVDEKRGQMLLEMLMQTGNFGHQDEKQREARSTTVGSLKYKVKQWWQLVRLYPEETLSAPVWAIYMGLKH